MTESIYTNMSIILFIVVLAVLIFVHELGHFLAARSTGTRVDEFGIGFPPKLFSWKPKEGETRYSLNLIPFGGFVKIFGEESPEEGLPKEEQERSFFYKHPIQKIWMLAAGVIFNILFAWLLLSLGYLVGLPTVLDHAPEGSKIVDAHVTVVEVLPDSPAATGDLRMGDVITHIDGEEAVSIAFVQDSIVTAENQVELSVRRGDIEEKVVLEPSSGVLEDRRAIGVALDMVGRASLPVHRAILEGARLTTDLTGAVAIGLYTFFADAVGGGVDFSSVAGPIGIVGLVGDASELGLVYVLTFTALISINLALLNLVPFPALDGGRILFVIIESIKGSPIKPRIASTLNTVGFALLILLMVAVTYSDVLKLFES